jgi:hypothetical protein
VHPTRVGGVDGSGDGWAAAHYAPRLTAAGRPFEVDVLVG